MVHGTQKALSELAEFTASAEGVSHSRIQTELQGTEHMDSFSHLCHF